MADLLAIQAGTDGHEYEVRVLEWTLDRVEEFWDKIAPYNIFSDDMAKSPEGFLAMILDSAGSTLWFEIRDTTDNDVVGLMYISEIALNLENQPQSAKWHGMLWGGKAGPRRPVLRAAIKELFYQFKLHRLEAEIPMHFGGVIRAAKKIGFVEEGRKRQVALFKGVWFDALLLSILDHEVALWET